MRIWFAHAVTWRCEICPMPGIAALWTRIPTRESGSARRKFDNSSRYKEDMRQVILPFNKDCVA
jgi:hypothetical protein